MNGKQKGTGTPVEPSNGRSATSSGNGKTRKVKFEVAAPVDGAVFLAGSFNNWDPQAIPMKRNGNGLHATSVLLAPGRHEYKFLVNGAWQIDTRCQQLAPNSYGSLNSVIEVT